MSITVVGTDIKAVKRVTCYNCSSILEYTDNDTTKETRTDYSGGSDIYTTLLCPECTNTITIT